MKTITFFGHRRLWGKDIRERLKRAVESNLEEETRCLIGVHGDYDRAALSICRELRQCYPNMKITIVFTTLTVLKKKAGMDYAIADFYGDVETMIYEIEEAHFKNRIILSNQKMVDESDLIIAYVDMDEYKSGAKKAVQYAIRKGKEVVNLFKKEDK